MFISLGNIPFRRNKQLHGVITGYDAGLFLIANTMHRSQWRARLGRVLFTIRWKLFGHTDSNYRCLIIRLPVDRELAKEPAQLTLQQLLRGRRALICYTSVCRQAE